MLLHADLSTQAVSFADEAEWVPSPRPGVERRMLERDGDGPHMLFVEEDIPASAREHVEFRWTEHVDEAAQIALDLGVGRETAPVMAEAGVAD